MSKTMSKTNQESKRKLASLVAALIVLGYIGSYTPALVSYWEDTWYPHGRESRVIAPGEERNVLGVQTQLDVLGPIEDEHGVENWPLFMPKQLPQPPIARTGQDRGEQLEV